LECLETSEELFGSVEVVELAFVGRVEEVVEEASSHSVGRIVG
jgi:hypothetical protein